MNALGSVLQSTIFISSMNSIWIFNQFYIKSVDFNKAGILLESGYDICSNSSFTDEVVSNIYR